MTQNQDKLIGYWAFSSETQFNAQIYIRFTENDLLQWGFENEWNICVMPHTYWIENGKIGTICPPNPRKEQTLFEVNDEGVLKLVYSNRETLWKRAEKQNFFESKNKKICEWGSQYGRQFDYMTLLDKKPDKFQIQRAEYMHISPQIFVNTNALRMLHYYAQAEFSAFHFDDFKYILEQGVYVNEEDDEDTKLLSYFAGDGYTNAVELMLDYGFEINAKDILDNTALDYAIRRNQSETAEILRKRGAKSGKEIDELN